MTAAESVVTTVPQRQSRRLTLPPLLVARTMHAVLWLLVTCAAGAGFASLLLQRAGTATAPALELPADPSRAEATAEVFLWAYLGQAGQGLEAVLEPFLSEPVDLGTVTPHGLYVLRTAVLTSEAVSPGYWHVTVAADVLTAVDGGYQPAGIRYYTIGVTETSGRLAVTGPPSLVAAPPSTTEPPRLAVPAVGRPDGGDELDAGLRFLEAYLTASGELDRYTAPSLEIEPVSPRPYTAVAVQRAGLARTHGRCRPPAARAHRRRRSRTHARPRLLARGRRTLRPVGGHRAAPSRATA